MKFIEQQSVKTAVYLYIIVLTDVKCITKHQYSSDLWPLKIKRNFFC